MSSNKEDNFYNFDYWFNNPEEHKEEDNYGENYYGYKLYKHLVTKLTDIPNDGYIVLLGTNRCVGFELLCKHFGRERCIGFDLFNPTNHDRVVIKDCMTLSSKDDIPIAFVHNDLGSFPTTPKLKIHAQEWAARNVIKGGYFLGRNNLNRAKYKAEEFLKSLGFNNEQLCDLLPRYGISKDMFDDKTIEGHILSNRKGSE